MSTKKEIKSREDIELLVDTFYKQVVQNPVIGHFFTEVVELDWSKHIPVMYDFWETTLLGNIKYKGNPMVKHFQLNQKSQLQKEHFNEWLRLWKDTIDSLFVGEKALEAKQRASSIADIIQFKISSLN